jgi:hypothetical protein
MRLEVVILNGVRLSPLGIAATTGLLYQPQMIDDGDCGEIGGMRIDKGKRSTRRKPSPPPLCPTQIPHDQTPAQTRAAADGKLAANRLSCGPAPCGWWYCASHCHDARVERSG